MPFILGLEIKIECHLVFKPASIEKCGIEILHREHSGEGGKRRRAKWSGRDCQLDWSTRIVRAEARIEGVSVIYRDESQSACAHHLIVWLPGLSGINTVLGSIHSRLSDATNHRWRIPRLPRQLGSMLLQLSLAYNKVL